jgi:hypothetical protein
MSTDDLGLYLNSYAKAKNLEHSLVKVYDFSIGQTVFPKITGNGEYLTTKVCFLYIAGKGEISTKQLPSWKNEIADLGSGWKFLRVEMNLGMTIEQFRAALDEAEQKLLEARFSEVTS